MRTSPRQPLPPPGRAGGLERLFTVVLTLAAAGLVCWVAAMLCGVLL